MGERDGTRRRLTAINPVAVLGPIRSAQLKTSVDIIARMLDGRLPLLPNAGIQVVDVRDVSAAHIAAMDDPASIGERYIVADDYLWLREMAAVLREDLVARAAEIQVQSRSNELTEWRVRVEHRREVVGESNRHQVELSIQALKVALLVNRGAAVASLAFLGNVLDVVDESAAQRMVTALETFCTAVALAAVASGLPYFVQFCRTLALDKYFDGDKARVAALRARPNSQIEAAGPTNPRERSREAWEATLRADTAKGRLALGALRAGKRLRVYADGRIEGVATLAPETLRPSKRGAPRGADPVVAGAGFEPATCGL